MKNFFIINPVAGNGKGITKIKEEIDKLNGQIKEDNEFIIIETTRMGDGVVKAEEIVKQNQSELINIFACGGDGTCFEVLNGIVGADNVNFGVIPVGSCNDFLKSFPECDFLDLKSQLNGVAKKTDIIKVDNEYVLNVANFGFDARANHDQILLRPKFKTIKGAYNMALFKNIISPKLGDKVEIFVDGNKVFAGKMLLSAVANAQYYGGGYKCAPHSLVDDGLIDIVIVKKVSILTFARLVKYYKNGEHLDHPKFKKYITYVQGKDIEIKAVNDLVASFDGETRIKKQYIAEIVEKKINFIFPRNK